jgi:hypothetical protein
MKSAFRHVLTCSLVVFPSLLLVDRPANATEHESFCNIIMCVTYSQECTYQTPNGRCYVWGPEKVVVTGPDGRTVLHGPRAPGNPSSAPAVLNAPNAIAVAVSPKSVAPTTGAMLSATTNWQSAGAIAGSGNARRPR